ncbi:NAD(P)-dependent alcohol dehydrogenase [Solihabitans fulvus]|uniref:NAD(P)-dependent alcohol dehydrogenase n=1 Tax=Solihabitans fulvus TaxID=1892852 RepID=A0A5B2X3Z7_9PSEU|nr:NAD(P)-dependent alcohol dehydrogenase [Solihabitans fulvus]KAA2257923.1 NAD(P)-dependent alcohol dehydrogenase [Solihabitans fulvus]
MSSTLTTTAIGYHLDRVGNGTDGLTLRETEFPQPGPREVLIRVRAVSLNRRDLMILDGTYPLPSAPGVVPVSDGAGEVVAVGGDVSRVRVGDRVAVTYFRRWIDGPVTAAVAGEQTGCNDEGMLAEYKLAGEESVVTIPSHLSFEEAATLPCAAVLAWSALTSPDRPMVAGDTVLTVGTGTVGLFGLQLAAMLGGRVIAITSGADKAARLTALGAAEVVDRADTPDWDKAVVELTSGRGVDHVVDAVGPATLEKSIRSAGFNGQIALLGAFPSGGAQLDPGIFNGRFVTVRKLVVGSRTSFESLNRALEQHGTRPVVDRVFPFEQAMDAYRYFRETGPFGKVVISLPA